VNFIATMNVYDTVKYLLHDFICMLMDLIMDTDSVPVDKAVDSSTSYVIFQICFAELHVNEIESSIRFEPSAT